MPAHMRMNIRSAVVLLSLCLAPLTAAAGPLQDDLQARAHGCHGTPRSRQRSPIFWSAPVRVYSLDVDYEYRQDSNLLYLTGIDQEDTILVLMPGNETAQGSCSSAKPMRAASTGTATVSRRQKPPRRAASQTVLTADQFEPFIAAMLSRRPMGGRRGRIRQRSSRRSKDGRAKLALLLEPQSNLSDTAGTRDRSSPRRLRERFFGFDVKDATPSSTTLRQIKTAYEQDVLRQQRGDLERRARAGMKAAAPGKYEYEVEAAIEEVYMRNGAMSWGYPSIVGSGPNATILHYSKSSRQMEPGDLLLVDAAAQLPGADRRHHAHLSDQRHASRREQRDIYEIVLRRAGGRRSRPRRPARAPADIQAACDDVLRAGLVRLGLVTDADRQAVQDLGDARRRRTGSAWTCTTSASAHARRSSRAWPSSSSPASTSAKRRSTSCRRRRRTPRSSRRSAPWSRSTRTSASASRTRSCMTATGLERLSATVPRSVDEIEQFMKPGSHCAPVVQGGDGSE